MCSSLIRLTGPTGVKPRKSCMNYSGHVRTAQSQIDQLDYDLCCALIVSVDTVGSLSAFYVILYRAVIGPSG